MTCLQLPLHSSSPGSSSYQPSSICRSFKTGFLKLFTGEVCWKGGPMLSDTLVRHAITGILRGSGVRSRCLATGCCTRRRSRCHSCHGCQCSIWERSRTAAVSQLHVSKLKMNPTVVVPHTEMLNTRLLQILPPNIHAVDILPAGFSLPCRDDQGTRRRYTISRGRVR